MFDHVDDEYIHVFDSEGSIMTLATPVMRRVHQPRLCILFILYVISDFRHTSFPKTLAACISGKLALACSYRSA